MIYLLLIFHCLWAENTLVATGAISKKDSQVKEFTYERYFNQKGELLRDRSIYKNNQGLIVVEEHMERVNGKLLRYDINQKQSSEKGWIVINNKQVIYNVRDKEGNLKKSKRSLPENFIVPLELFHFLKDNKVKLLAGESVSLKLGVWKRRDHYSFYMKEVEGPKDEIVIKMQLSNIILRAFTSPMYFIFDRKTEQIKSYQGPLNLKDPETGNVTDYIGQVKYDLIKAQ